MTLLSELRGVLDPGGIVDPEQLSKRPASWSRRSDHAALGLVRPRSTAEVSEILRICNRRGQALVVQGGMTGLVDGATASSDELALSLERMNRIEAVDVVGRTLTVEAGAILQNVQDAAQEHGLLFPPDWGARGTATIGGGIATNAGGSNVLRYGMMREQVLGLEVVLADGTVLSSMNRLLKNNTGYDLKQFFIGSEGTLGVITRAVLRLRPAPRSENTALLALRDLAAVSRLLQILDGRLAGTLTAFEVMWRSHYEMTVESGQHRWALPAGYPFYVLVESRGADPTADRAAFEAALGAGLDEDLFLDSMLCNSKADRNALWAIRDDIPALSRALAPMIVYDVSVPLADMDVYLNAITKDIAADIPGARGVVFGHLGDGNLHLCWHVDQSLPGPKRRLSEIIYSHLVPFGGSISAEHGIGFDKLAFLSNSKSDLEIHWMRNIKRLFDSKDLLNRGRVVGALGTSLERARTTDNRQGLPK
jgi:FAD/FMN-containing dehydrogenase